MKQFAIIGLGRFGSSVAKTLSSTGNDVLGIDADEEKVQNISDYITHAAQADATDEAALKALGIRNFDVVVITIGQDIQASILVTLLCKEAGVKYVLAKAQSELHAKVLYKIGADKVVLPERDMGMRVAHNLISSSILEYIELAPEYTLVEVLALKDWEGKTLAEINIRANFGVNVIAIKHKGSINVSPSADDYIKADDVIVVIGSKEDINTLSLRAQHD